MKNQNVKEIILTKNLARKCVKYFQSNLPKESVAFIFGKTIEKQDGSTLIATEPLFPKEDDYISRSETKCKVSFNFMVREFPKKSKSGKEMVLSWHSHPMDGLSYIDEENGHLELLKGFPNVLTGYFNGGRFGFFQYKDGFRQVKHRIVEMKFFDRQTRAFGHESQYRLLATHVALIGCGGASQLAYLLAEQGIGLTLVDPDTWDSTSLNRVWVPKSHVGMSKAKSLQKLLRWRDVEVRAFPCAIEDLPLEALEDVDILVAMTDTFKSRIHVNRVAVSMKKPAIFAGAEIRAKDDKIETMVGNCVIYLPEKFPCYECNLEIDPHRALKELMDRKKWRRFARKYGLPTYSSPVPSLASLNNIIVSLVSDEILKMVTGYSTPIHYQYWDHLKRTLLVVDAERNPECPTCGELKPTRVNESDLISSEEAFSAGSES